MLQFHIITRGISPHLHPLAAAWLAASMLLVTAPDAALARPLLEDPSPTLWALSIAPESRARDVYLDAGGLPEVAAVTDVHWLVSAAVRRLEQQARLGSREHGRTAARERPDVVRAIVDAAARTGISSAWLLRTARRESGLDPHAVSRSSTATGLYQFVEDTWLRSVRLYGAAHGFGREAARVSLGSDGVVSVAPADRPKILALRTDARLASLLAAELARANRRAMTKSLARPISDGELYVAHFLGAAGAVRLIRAAERTPTASAVSILPRAASANPSVFNRGGRALSAAQLLWKLKHA